MNGARSRTHTNMPMKSATKRDGSADGAARETGTVRRVLLMLGTLIDKPGLSANQIATELNLPRSTAHRLLAMLRADSFALLQKDGSFAAGPELYRLAGRLRASLPHARLAQPLLEQLSARFDETSVLAILDRRQLKMFYASTASPADPMRYNIAVNRLEPLVWGATGRAILAHLPAADVEAAIRLKEPSPADGQPLKRAELQGSLAQIRRQGFAVTHSHRTRGAVGIAVPFFDADGQVLGDVGFLIPEFRFARHHADELVRALSEAAASLTRQFGGLAPAVG